MHKEQTYPDWIYRAADALGLLHLTDYYLMYGYPVDRFAQPVRSSQPSGFDSFDLQRKPSEAESHRSTWVLRGTEDIWVTNETFKFEEEETTFTMQDT